MERKIEWNKVTWYSKLLAIILFVLTFYIGMRIGMMKASIPAIPEITPNNSTPEHTEPISIGSKDITEQNFTGKVAVVAGSELLATQARQYVENTLKEFRAQADRDVPELRKQFGADSPTSNYSINIDAEYLQNPKTDSMVINVYTYTGGAHGSSYFKVFTVSKKDQKILSIADALYDGSEDAFVALVKKELKTWPQEGSGYSPVFPDVVDDLKLTDFSEWSLDSNNLTIYFSQYAIGPGALGEVRFPIPFSKVKDLLMPDLY